VSPTNEKGGLLAAAFIQKDLFGVLQHLNVFCLPPFRAFDDVERNWLSFFQAAKTIGLNRGKVNKYVFTVFPGNKAVAFSVIEPLHCSLFHV